MIIAEAGVNHNGCVKTAKKLIDMAKRCGADVVKFQTFKAYETSGVFAEKANYQKINMSDNDNSQIEMLKKLELPFEAFKELQNYCKQNAILFMSTPDGDESLRCLEELNVPIIKIGSTEITNYPFLKKIARTSRKILLSTGMSNLGEVEKAIGCIMEEGNTDLELMHCTTDYPTKYEDANLKAIVTLREAFKLKVGYSDHTEGIEAVVAAIALGASCIEKHITLDRNAEGPDHKASMDEEMFRKYVDAIKKCEMMLGDGIKRPTNTEVINMASIRRSIIASKRIEKGSVLSEDDLCFKRPGTGLPLDAINYIIGRKVKRTILPDEIIMLSDFE